MAKIDSIIFGYRVISANSRELAKICSILLRAGISCEVKPDGRILMREKYFKSSVALLKDIQYTSSDVMGITGWIKRINNKAAVIIAIIISIIAALWTYNLVWDVRIDGNSEITDAAVIRIINENGFGVGNLWSKTNIDEIEKNILENCKAISWININRRGTVAYVTLLENDQKDGMDNTEKIKYANIVASNDCVIEEITVLRGKAAVKVGDTVKKGDLLISGVLPDEAGGGLCCAEGTVVGKISEEISVYVDREYTELTDKKEVICSVDLKIFNFCVNIFKKHRNLDAGCDIIKEINIFSLFGKRVLPFELHIDYAVNGNVSQSLYSDRELISVACDRLTSETARKLRDCDLISIRTYGDYTENGYSVSNKVVFTSEVGLCLPFELEK